MATTESIVEGVSAIAKSFHWADYLVFALFLAISVGIGIYYGVFAKQKTAKEFLLGGKGMQVLPVATAIMSSFLSAILILGTPAEIYTKGTLYYMYTFGMMSAVVFATVLFVPLLYPLKLTSSYEYLEKRFHSKSAKLTGTLILFTSQVLYLGIAMYAPATALEAVTGFPEWATIIIGGIVSVIYTSLGGMKASVWASAFQTLVMAAGVIAVIVKGAIDVGGLDEVWRLCEEGGRIEFFNWDTNVTTRHTTWSLIVGGTIGWLSTYGVNQASVQRFSGMPTLNKGRAVLLLNIPGLLFFMTICVLSGMTIFAYYSSIQCDPLAAGFVTNSNQLIPYFVMDRLDIPGIPGLFLACLFGGALSSISGALAALTAVTWEDVFKQAAFFRDMSDRGQTIVNKLLVVLFGALGIGMAFMSATLGGTVLEASLSFTGASGGPLLGLFLLGGLFPCTNWIGAVVGGLVGLALPLWISAGAYEKSIVTPSLNTTIEMCIGIANNTEPTSPPLFAEDLTGIETIYRLSYLWYPAVGAATCVVLGILVSMITNCIDPADADPRYFIPFFDRLFCYCPGQTRKVLRCNIDMQSPEEITAQTIREQEEKEELRKGMNQDQPVEMQPTSKQPPSDDDEVKEKYAHDNDAMDYKPEEPHISPL